MNIFGALPKKTMLLVLFLATILVVLLFFLLYPKNPTPQLSPNNQNQPTIPISRLTPAAQKTPSYRSTFVGVEKPAYNIIFNIPEGLLLPPTIENVEVSREIDDSYINHLKSRLGIKGNPVASKSTYLWYSYEQKKSLQIDTNSGYVQYGTDDVVGTDTSTTPDQAKNIAEKFLKELNVASISPNTAIVTMFTGEGEPTETKNEAIATMYEVSYVQGYKGIPIYYHFAKPATISVTVDKRGAIRGFKYFNIRPTRTIQTTLLSLDQVKERVSLGEFAVVKVSGNQETIPKSGTITITRATAIHFDDKKNPSFFPTVLLEGTLKPSGREVSLYFSVLSD